MSHKAKGGVITPEAALSILRANEKRNPPLAFSVRFFKRSNGELREMSCFPGKSVNKTGLAGGEAAYDPKEHSLFWTYLSNTDPNYNPEDKTKNRRSINVPGIVELTVHGVTYAVLGGKD